MAIRKIFKGKVAELRPAENRKEVCLACAMAVPGTAMCTTMDSTCLDHMDSNWQIIDELPTTVQIEDEKYFAVPGGLQSCEDCVVIPDVEVCQHLAKFGMCMDHYWLKEEQQPIANEEE